MDFPTYIEVVSRSAPADWNVEEGPLFLAHTGGAPGARTSSHSFMMAYRKNLSITMAFGLLHLEDLREPWTAVFPEKRASLRYLDCFFNAALVFRETFAVVDGDQCVLPVPNPGPTEPYEVPRRKSDVARLVHQITNPMRDFDDYFAYAKMRVIDEHWPL